jgi:rSAM/selenodomain-associated transferase 1
MTSIGANRSNRIDSLPSTPPDLPSSPNALVVVAKRPAPGHTKTRLTPPLTPMQAALLYECFLRDTLDLVRSVPGARPVIAYLPAQARPYFAQLAPDFELVVQKGEDLGTRLENAFTYFFRAGYRQVAIMNSDGPSLPATWLRQAFHELARGADVVLGPCDDGGYYLIGLRRPAPRLLREVRMSTSHVLTDTLALAAVEGLRVELLPTWYDVDDAQDLARLKAELDQVPDGVARHTRALMQRADWVSGEPTLGFEEARVR